MEKAMSTQEQKLLSEREKIFYGFGDMSNAIVWGMTTIWVMFFLTNVFKISAIAAGTLLLTARIWDAANEPMVGLLVDKTQTRMGKARPYLLFFAIPYGLAGCFVFFTPDFSPSGKLMYAYILYCVLVLLYTLVNIPYNSMIALMTKNPNERIQLSRNRLLFALAAFMVVSMPPQIAQVLGNGTDPAQVQQTGFFRVAIIFGIVATLGFLISV
nr:MFS transporter [uncultured Desulfobacter sp.]